MHSNSQYPQFVDRHIGPDDNETKEMLSQLNMQTVDKLIDAKIPRDIRLENEPTLPEAMREAEFLAHIEELGKKNSVFDTYIGMGYYDTHTPSPILRNIFENPGWYTQYTPYQAEISQGRLEALLNFQTMVSDLCQLPLANASLLDEGTAAAEAMSMFYAKKNKRNKSNPIKKFFVDKRVFPQTHEVLMGRAIPQGIDVVLGDIADFEPGEEYFGILLQYPATDGNLLDYTSILQECKEHKIFSVCATDLLSLVLLKAPGNIGFDAAVGNSQRFGVPLGAGGPHAAFFATDKKFKRLLPGRIIGVSEDTAGRMAVRMALQTREQHIKREKATSNICTAQALLAIMAGMYAVYHGKEGLNAIARAVHQKTQILFGALQSAGIENINAEFFDTLSFRVDASSLASLKTICQKQKINLSFLDETVSISLDECTSDDKLKKLIHTVLQGLGKTEDTEAIEQVFTSAKEKQNSEQWTSENIPANLQRESDFLTHPVFSLYRNETELMRYIKTLERKDLSLTHSMIPLGSCTMKLNAATELLALSRPEWSKIHPFAPGEQRTGYLEMMGQLSDYLAEITGFKACSLQPNSGAQGELTGLLTIRAYHEDMGGELRDVVLIPDSAHGTNPASAVMAGMQVVVVKTDENGNIDLEDLEKHSSENSSRLAAMMVTYPSTFGVFEPGIKNACEIIHKYGGLVYMDGANMNAQMGYTHPETIGADVCHLNLHKTFAIPHGGGGPGMGPICVNEKLAPFLPSHPLEELHHEKGINAVNSAPYGSASILLISYAFIRMLGLHGLKKSTATAILNANYIANRLGSEYQILFGGKNARTAHELIVDLRPFKAAGISAEDVAKRLIDYGFHAPTLSFPVPGTIMIEPTESENKAELDKFCEALLSIKGEIDEVARGEYPQDDNVLTNAPHHIAEITANEWPYSYSREKAAWPLPYLRQGHKFWPAVSRVKNAYGDRNLICICPPIEEYA